MDEITKQIEEMADKMEKSTQDPKEALFKAIRDLGKDGLKEKLKTLSDEEKVVLKAALEEMTLEKAVTFDAEAQAVKPIQGKVSDTIIQEEIASDDADEKLVKPAAAKMDHQGTPTEGWSGQVIKSLEEHLDLIIEKAMEQCNDENVVSEKLKAKGMDGAKVQGALDKYKEKKEVKKSEEDLEKGKMKEAREDAKEKIMQMEEKEHGTKDPKKLVEAEKKENKMEKSALPEKANPEVDQVGDAPDMEGGKQMAKKTSAPDIDDNAKANKKNMTKSCTWDDDNRLFKSNVLGRNHSFNLEQFVEETLKSDEVQKSEGKDGIGADQFHDMIQKGEDRNWTELKVENQIKEHKTSGSLFKSFDDVKDIADSMGISVEDAKKILGE